MRLNDRPSPLYVLIQRSRDDAFVRCWGGFLRLSGDNRRGGGCWWRRRRRRRRRWWRRRRFRLRLELGFGLHLHLDKRDVRRGEKPATCSVRASPEPPVRVFLHDLHDEFAFDERQLVVFCSLQCAHRMMGIRRDRTAGMTISHPPRSRTARLPFGLDHLQLELTPRARAQARAQARLRAHAR